MSNGRLAAHLDWGTMRSLLFLFGLLVGIGGAVMALSGVVIAVVTALAWLNSAIVSSLSGP